MDLKPDSLIDPVLLFYLALMAGTLVVIVPTNLRVGEPEPEVQAAAKNSGVPADPVELGRRQADLRQLSDEISASHRRLQRLRFETSRLDTLLRKPPAVAPEVPVSEPTSDVLSLENLARDKQAELSQLTAEYDSAKASGNAMPLSAPVTSSTDKTLVWFGFVKNRVLPLDAEHYTSVTGTLKTGGRVTVSTPKKAGETEEEMLRPGSVLRARLQAIDPAKQAAAFLVHNDSFPIFRRARQLARERNIDVAWDPNDSSDGRIILGSAAAGGVSVVPQRPAK